MHARMSALLLALMLASVTAFAQTETARITGTVTDAQGAVVPGVTVTATSRASGAVRTTVTDAAGKYVIANILPGVYDIRLELSGFKPVAVALQIPVGGSITFDGKLELGAVSETIEVSATAPELINTANAEVATVIRQEQLRDLPTLTRNPYDLVSLAGNVAEQPFEQIDNNNARRGPGFNINGTRASANNVLLDGAANNNEFDTTVGQEIPLDAVQEFSVVSNNYSAQYGRAAGGIINVATKAGTNQFRGTAYDFYRSDTLSTNSQDNRANDIPKGKFNRHQMGYSLGGPIVRNKIQFFSSLEYIRVRSSDALISWVPTPQFLAASSPVTRAYFNQYAKGGAINGPVLTRGQIASIVGSGAGAFNSLPADLPVFGQVRKELPTDAGGGDPQNHYQFVGRADLNLSNSSQVYLRYAYQNRETMPGTQSASPYDGFDTGDLKHNHNILGSLTHVFSNTMTSQTKFVYNRLFELQPVPTPSQPRLMMNSGGAVRLQGYRVAFPGYLPFQPGNDIPFGGPQKLAQFYHDQTWLTGAHDIRFGGSYVHIADDRTFSAYSNAVEALNTTNAALPSLNNFVLGQLARYQAAINPQGFPGGTFVTPVSQPSFTSFNRYKEFALYGQDNLRITPRVTLNAGLRYEYFGPQEKSTPKYDSNFYYGNPDLNIDTASPKEIIDAVRTGTVKPSNESPTGTLWKKRWTNFAPRIGLAWDATGDGRTSIRGGYGIGYERNFGNVTFNVLFNPPQYLVATIDAPQDVATLPISVDNLGPFAGTAGIRKLIPAGSLRHVDQNIKTAYTHFYGVSFQREIGAGTYGAIEYNGSTGRNLYDLSDINKRGAPLVYEGAASCAGLTPPGAAAPLTACTATTRPNPLYGAFNSRGNRGRSQYQGVTFSLDSRRFASNTLALTGRYTIASSKDNLSTTFSDGNNGFFNLGYVDVFDPMLDYGYAEFDVRHRVAFSALYSLPFFENRTGMARTLLGGWEINPIFTAHSGYPFSLFDCTNGVALCMRAIDTANISKKATGHKATGNPNEYELLDLTPILGGAGSYTNPITGNSDFGPYPGNMTERDAFRGPGAWFFDLAVLKRFRFGDHYAAQFRLEAYNVLDHGNMRVNTENADISSFSMITGKKDSTGTGNRRVQLGFKLEF